ncbi:hypothetical protein BDY19DRAFT_972413 [Irpex rosettiformis]|uniref:Uncharacterized protein n=1 Tax=Irpex rosettiformis TaxID=378272 RepID=A0ACB8TQQ7_9APHY|nr:hypothetical protein BDY19DRAFT_972413 [Irpex rosettiformis]
MVNKCLTFTRSRPTCTHIFLTASLMTSVFPLFNSRITSSLSSDHICAQLWHDSALSALVCDVFPRTALLILLYSSTTLGASLLFTLTSRSPFVLPGSFHLSTLLALFCSRSGFSFLSRPPRTSPPHHHQHSMTRAVRKLDRQVQQQIPLALALFCAVLIIWPTQVLRDVCYRISLSWLLSYLQGSLAGLQCRDKDPFYELYARLGRSILISITRSLSFIAAILVIVVVIIYLGVFLHTILAADLARQAAAV